MCGVLGGGCLPDVVEQGGRSGGRGDTRTSGQPQKRYRGVTKGLSAYRCFAKHSFSFTELCERIVIAPVDDRHLYIPSADGGFENAIKRRCWEKPLSRAIVLKRPMRLCGFIYKWGWCSCVRTFLRRHTRTPYLYSNQCFYGFLYKCVQPAMKKHSSIPPANPTHKPLYTMRCNITACPGKGTGHKL
jgi:hypothetical protein